MHIPHHVCIPPICDIRPERLTSTPCGHLPNRQYSHVSSEPWFIYRREGGRIRFAPATWQGWLTFVSGIVTTILVTVSVMLASGGQPFWVRFASPFLVISTGVLALCVVAVRKGRPSL
jgi:hypothetical protein